MRLNLDGLRWRRVGASSEAGGVALRFALRLRALVDVAMIINCNPTQKKVTQLNKSS